MEDAMDIKVFVHGVPVGHEMCGCDTDDEKDYLRQFYDFKTEASSAMVIDIYGGVSYYTYIRKNNLTNCDGRPGSYFGITVSFGKATCDNVYELYNILHGLYSQLIVGTLIKETKEGGYSYILREINNATIKNNNILFCLKALIQKNIVKNIGDDFSPIESSITTKGNIGFNIEEVDSPYFKYAVKSKRVVVSSEFKMSAKLASELEQKLTPLDKENSILRNENVRLKSEIEQLNFDKDNLFAEKAALDDAAKRKYQELQTELYRVSQERDELLDIITQTERFINSICDSSTELMSLWSSQFHKKVNNRNNRGEANKKDKYKSESKNLWNYLSDLLRV